VEDGVATVKEQRVSAKDRAYEFVKDRILYGTYRGGELISEGDVATDLEMSRTPVREAFLRLESEGLLRLYPQRGALVIPVSPEEVRQVLEARSVLEEFAVRKAVSRPDQHRVALRSVLEESIARQRGVAAGGDLRAFLLEDRNFHVLLVEAGDNGFLSQVYATLRDRQVRMIADTHVSDVARRETILDEHCAIATAIGEGDPEAACAAVHVHLASTRAALGLAPEQPGKLP
jgi:DNA-binding GntR family transcriptional regulator